MKPFLNGSMLLRSIDLTREASFSLEVLLKHSRGIELAIEATESTLWVTGILAPRLLAIEVSNFIPFEFKACATKTLSSEEKLPSWLGVIKET